MGSQCIVTSVLLTVATLIGAVVQENDVQERLLTAVEALDAPGVTVALKEGANPTWVKGTTFGGRGFSVISRLVLFGHGKEPKLIEILGLLVQAGVKLQACDDGILFLPVSSGHSTVVKKLIEMGADPQHRIDGLTPMEIAVYYGKDEVVDLLAERGIKKIDTRAAAQLHLSKAACEHDIIGMDKAIREGAGVNAEDSRGQTALVLACGSLSYENYGQYLAVHYLLDMGADPRVHSMERGDAATTALHCAVVYGATIMGQEEHREGAHLYARLTIETLLRHGAYVSATDGEGCTPLHLAAHANSAAVVKLLIDAGAKITPRDKDGKTPLDYAESGDVIRLLKDSGAKEH
jgi:ankyrin repeat protein